MPTIEELDKIAINLRSHKLLKQILKENPKLEEILRNAGNETDVLEGIGNWVRESLRSRPHVLDYHRRESSGHGAYSSLKWSDFAAVRLLDYIDNAGMEVKDFNLRGEKAASNPIRLLWLAVDRGTGGATPHFFEDMLQLFRQFNGRSQRQTISQNRIEEWMGQYTSGLDPRIVRLREENRDRIINIIIDMIDSGKKRDPKFKFERGTTRERKFEKALEWWNDRRFHLKFAVRTPELLNEMLGCSLDPDTLEVLNDAKAAGIPFFVNPYYLSLMYVGVPDFADGGDLAIRDYVLYTRQLVDEYGKIKAWEKEDETEPGKPNAAGWLLPGRNIHRRYPEVAILIPDTVGRACGGLCSTCQRMYGFQNDQLDFDLERLKPKKTWSRKLNELMAYFENDSQLRDILVTGGDALMSSNKSLEQILAAIYEMAVRKKEKNKSRKNGEKYADIVRVRLGTRLPAYLPQRIDSDVVDILARFKEKSSKIGIKQFVIQTHFESPLEVTPEARDAVKGLISAGWTVVNQLVYTTAASRRGYTTKLRQVLNEIGVLSYYTFTVKGYMENHHNFATNARAVQEQTEEKVFGTIPESFHKVIRKFPQEAEKMVENISKLRKAAHLPFLATDRNVINLPGVGKSQTFRVVGITRYGRRILEFDHDATRRHSPIISKMGRIVIVESKPIGEYLEQLEEMGDALKDYDGIYGYSIGETENRIPIYDYPDYNYQTTGTITNLEIEE
ncbi:MAG: KamA family protein [Proteobacteria bacterium]|nr:KamA family protein [Pseudomonadota bacterium]